MADKTFIIPLRKEFSKTKPYKRAKKSVSAVRQYLERHMKSEDVRIGKYLNQNIWEHGIKNPPARIEVTATKDDKGIVRAELVGAPKEVVKEEKEVKPQGPIVAKEVENLKEKIQKKLGAPKKTEEKTEEKPKAEEKPAEKKEEVKPVDKKTEEKPAEKKEEAKEEPKADEKPKEEAKP